MITQDYHPCCPMHEMLPCRKDRCQWWNGACCAIEDLASNIDGVSTGISHLANVLEDMLGSGKICDALNAVIDLPSAINFVGYAIGGDDE